MCFAINIFTLDNVHVTVGNMRSTLLYTCNSPFIPVKQNKQYYKVHIIVYQNDIFVDLEFEHKDPDPGNFVTSEDEGLRLKWTAFLEFTQNQDVGDMTWDKVVHQ